MARERRAAADDGEFLHTPADKHAGMLPREKFARTRGVSKPRRPALWAARNVAELGVPPAGAGNGPQAVFGAYPKGFVAWALRQLHARPREVLHVCSGMLDEADGGVRLDIARRARPHVQADGRALPFRSAAFGGVLIDPPYSVEYAEDLYGTEYPRPSHLLAEASRVVRPCGRIGFLHFFVPFPPPGTRIVSVSGITTGCGYRIRAFTVFEREQDGLPGVV